MTIPDLAAHGPCRAPSDQGQRISPIWQIRYLEASWGSLPLGNHGRACTSLFAYDSMTLWSCKNLWMKETSCMEASSPNAIHCACWVFKHSQTLSSNFRFCMHLNYMIWSGNATYVKHCAENCINIYIYVWSRKVGKRLNSTVSCFPPCRLHARGIYSGLSSKSRWSFASSIAEVYTIIENKQTLWGM